ncbi:MAG: hypothetical protein O2955_12955 [Planctomycetota bacterium]|nr:hypothetical protein [Planctomycetota bacterium]MDA1213418.1 hypothetical protein [Planctomycetota bacterium]
MLRKLFLLCALSSSLWMVTGCGGSDTPAPDDGGVTPAPIEPAKGAAGAPDAAAIDDTADMPSDDTTQSGDTTDNSLASNSKPTPPTTTPPSTPVKVSDEPAETPDAAMLAMIQGVRNQQLEAAWNFMPPSYRDEVNSLVQAFAGKMDPEIWDRTFEVLRHLVTALESKKEMILSDPNLEGAPLSSEQREEAFGAVIALLTTITECELSDLDKLKEFHGGEFLRGTGSSLMAQGLAMAQMMPGNPVQSEFLDKLDNTTVTVLTSEGDAATVQLEAPGEEPEEVALVRVEGYWIPKDFAEQFPGSIEQAKAQVEMISPEMIDAQKDQILAVLGSVDQIASGIEAAESREELTQTLQQAIAPIMMMAMGGGMGGPGSGIGDDPTDLVTVMVRGKVDDDTAAMIEEALTAAADDPDAAKDSVSTLKVEDLLSIDVAPVTDIQAFADKIEFGKVIDVDVEAKIITVEVGEESESESEDENSESN